VFTLSVQRVDHKASLECFPPLTVLWRLRKIEHWLYRDIFSDDRPPPPSPAVPKIMCGKSPPGTLDEGVFDVRSRLHLVTSRPCRVPQSFFRLPFSPLIAAWPPRCPLLWTAACGIVERYRLCSRSADGALKPPRIPFPLFLYFFLLRHRFLRLGPRLHWKPNYGHFFFHGFSFPFS